MNKMIAITIRPGATTAAARLICPFACKIPPPAATRTSAKVPSNSENSRRHSLRGSSKSFRSPNSRRQYVVRARERRPQRRQVGSLGRCPTHSIRRPCGPARPRTIRPAHRHVVCHVPVPPSTAPKKLHNEDRKCLQVVRGWCSRRMPRTQRPEPCFLSGSGPRPRRPAPGSPGRIRRAGVEPPPARGRSGELSTFRLSR